MHYITTFIKLSILTIYYTNHFCFVKINDIIKQNIKRRNKFMNKSHKTLFIFLIVLLLSYNLSESFLTIYCHTFCKETIEIIVIRAIPLLILLLCYLTNIRFSSKLSINYLYLFISIVSFLISKMHILFYLYLLYHIMHLNMLFSFNLHLSW